jgi:ribonuclease D
LLVSLFEQGLVADEASLDALVAALETTSRVGLAVEMETRSTYRPRIALLSLCLETAEERAFAVGIDARATLRTASSARDRFVAHLGACRVVAHGAEYTVAALRRELHIRLHDFTDTQQAAVLLGLPRTGLEALRTELLELPPRLLTPHVWGQGPVSRSELSQALSDVTDLPRLDDRLRAMIREKDLEDELQVASRLVEAPLLPGFIKNANIPDPRRFRQIPGASELTPDGLRVLSAMVRWRDTKAQELDIPSVSLLANAQLIEIARFPERAAARIADMRFHSRLVHADRATLRNVVITALAEEDVESPPAPPAPSVDGPASRPRKGVPTAAIKARLARLKVWRRSEADKRGVGLQAILPAVSMEHLAFFPRTPLSAVPGLGRRRVERYAAVLAALVAR